MSYIDFADDLVGKDEPNGMIPTAMRSVSASSSTSTIVRQQRQPKDFSDWRNIQLGATPTFLSPFWLSQTPVTTLSNSWTMSNNTMYSSPYNQFSSASQHLHQPANSNHNQLWTMPTFPIGTTQSFVSYNPSNMINNIADITSNPVMHSFASNRFDEYRFF